MKHLLIFVTIATVILCAYGFAYHCALGQMDVEHPQVPAVASVVLVVFGFPFMDFWSFLGGDRLKTILGDGGTAMLFALLDAGLWAGALTWLYRRWSARDNPR